MRDWRLFDRGESAASAEELEPERAEIPPPDESAAPPSDPAGTQPRWRLPAERPEPIPLRSQRALPPGAPLPAAAAAGGGGVGMSASDAGAEPAGAPAESRIHFLLGVLLALGIVAVAAIVLVARGGGQGGTTVVITGPSWSSWQPTAAGTGAVSQIAQHVGAEYRLPSGNQLVAVSGGPFQVQGMPFSIALRNPSSAGTNVSVMSGGGVLYQLCGLGTNCAIPEGRPSTQRGLLLGREALELALYTFHYVQGAQQVVVVIPPPQGANAIQAAQQDPATTPAAGTVPPNRVFYFRAAQLAPELQRPLDQTLSSSTPTVTTMAQSSDAQVVGRVAGNQVYRFNFAQAPDTSLLMILSPLA